MTSIAMATPTAERQALVPAAQLETVRRACRHIEARIAEGEGGTVTLAELGRHCRMSPWHLQRLFKQVMGVSPRQYGDAKRLERLRFGLQQGEGVAAATYEAGFGSSSRVYERADAALGMTPATYAKGGRGADIAYASAATPLGRLLVAATERGVCFVSLGESDAPLEQALAEEFPEASLRRDDSALSTTLVALLAYLDGAEPPTDLPLDIRCTAFQRRVWEELRRIPMGETRTYGEIAERLGQPHAQRAVGRACATNPVPLLVPCHRAVGRNGSVTGYRWGTQRKEALLALEQGEAPRRAAGRR